MNQIFSKQGALKGMEKDSKLKYDEQRRIISSFSQKWGVESGRHSRAGMGRGCVKLKSLFRKMYGSRATVAGPGNGRFSNK